MDAGAPAITAGWPGRDADHLLVDAEQMAGLEQALFASGLPVAALMEKAALAVARRLLHERAQLGEGVLALVGPGHNGGDALVVARELSLAGVPVRLWCPFDRRKPLTEEHWRHARWLGLPVLEREPAAEDGALWLDGLFGLGQRRPLPETLERLLGRRRRHRPGRLVALDVPSGLCSDTGRLLGAESAWAGLTCTIGLLKRGLLQDPALDRVGHLERIDLALPAGLLRQLPGHTPLALHPADRDRFPTGVASAAASKYERGRLLVIAGSDRFRGAASLVLAGAQASGCGAVRALLPAAHAERLWLSRPEVILERSLPCDPAGSLHLAAAPGGSDPPEMLPLARLDAVLLGPGIGLPHDPAAADPFHDPAWCALRATVTLLVLDADGLNRLAATGRAQEWLAGRGGPTWITPHRAEFARLFPDLEGEPPLRGAGLAAERSRAVVAFKGARTVVAAPDGRRWQVARASAAVARAGLGDVLAGYAAGLGARLGPDGAVLAAAVLAHAEAGCACDAGGVSGEASGGPGGSATTATAVGERLAGMTR
jgi:NAD(P)H-hydrate epimerase